MTREIVGPDVKSTSVGQVPMDRLRSVFDGMFDGVWLVAADGRTTYANEAMARLLGTTAPAMRGRHLTDFLDGTQWVQVVAFLERQRNHAGERIDLRFRRDDGSDLFGLVAGSPISTDDGVFVGTMLNVSDVTSKRVIDAQLAQNQRLEAIGQFAGGIAHDFNNLLTSIHGYAELALANVVQGDPVRDDLDQVLAGADRATAITRKLLAFTRRQILVPIDVDPGEVIVSLLPILEPLMGDGVDVAVDLESGHGWVRVDPTQLEQILVNLALNARDAMPAGGTVTIAVHDVALPDPERPDSVSDSGAFVRISVSDTGVGMDDATKSQVFDPFFTTKAPGKGTGLGLSTVLGIVAQSGGQVWVETQLGEGSTFHVNLPRVGVGASRRPAKPPRTPAAQSGTILIVEDDAAVREFARRSLVEAGYTVLAAADADQGLRASERWGETIDVLITDLVMPGAQGRDLAARICALRPDIGVVFMSGFSADAVDGDDGQFGSGEFLPKPFSVNALRAAVGRAARAGGGTRLN